jgi:hypothetical protein
VRRVAAAVVLAVSVSAAAHPAAAQAIASGNPIFAGWYADPAACALAASTGPIQRPRCATISRRISTLARRRS